MKSILSLRNEYSEYRQACVEENETPCSLRQWFETAYHYEMQDDVETGQRIEGFNDYRAAMGKVD